MVDQLKVIKSMFAEMLEDNNEKLLDKIESKRLERVKKEDEIKKNNPPEKNEDDFFGL